ncbi:MAG TPA: DUF1552 domain-containing protein, partial [Vicinamibacterales bacterium]|nr:DUF1552 domain-containing protein [Vicinamibacterales bacterium]
MMITKMHLPRRTFLKGVGATIALPFLDSMVPALTALSKTAAAPVRRLGIFYVPNGMAMKYWVPQAEGTAFELPRTLQSLAPYRDQVTVLTGLVSRCAYPLPGEGGGDHARSAATFLTGVHIKRTSAADVQAGVSADQIAAQHLAEHTQLASLELALESVELLGACDGTYACAYSNTIAWRSPSTPLPMEPDPRAVFERLFGTAASTDPAARLARVRRDRSILDSVSEKAERLQLRLPASDRTKLTEYLDAVRDVERRIQKAEEQSGREVLVVDQPAGIPGDFAEHAKLMMDLLALAYQSDMTRVATFMIAREVSSRPYPEIGVSDSHHPLSHHENDPAKLDRLGQINLHHVKQFAHLVEKLKATPDGDGSLLDHSMLVYGAGISDSNTHFHDNLPIVLVGGAAGGLKGGRHIRYPKEVPLTNLWLTVLDKMGVPAEKMGDSTG